MSDWIDDDGSRGPSAPSFRFNEARSDPPGLSKSARCYWFRRLFLKAAAEIRFDFCSWDEEFNSLEPSSKSQIASAFAPWFWVGLRRDVG